jgi:hypothetical protein
MRKRGIKEGKKELKRRRIDGGKEKRAIKGS